MIIHHMSDGSVRNSIDGIILPKRFEKVYELANSKKKENSNGNNNKTGTITEK